jgi:hypothetical protein
MPPFIPMSFPPRYRGPVFYPSDAPPATAAAPPAPPAPPPPAPAPRTDDAPEPDAKAWDKLMKESARHRVAAKEANEKLAQAESEREAAKTALAAAEAAKTAAETAKTTAEAAIKTTRTAASLQVAAIQAGIADLDFLKLIDVATLELDDKGELKDGAAEMAKLKAAKPHLFGTAPPAPRSSSNPQPPPVPAPPTHKKATDLTADEYKKQRADIAAGKTPAIT